MAKTKAETSGLRNLKFNPRNLNEIVRVKSHTDALLYNSSYVEE